MKEENSCIVAKTTEKHGSKKKKKNYFIFIFYFLYFSIYFLYYLFFVFFFFPSFTYIVPVTGNYVPVNEVALIKDTAASLSVVVDRSRGGCSDSVGELEFMNHRRLLVDDGRGGI